MPNDSQQDAGIWILRIRNVLKHVTFLYLKYPKAQSITRYVHFVVPPSLTRKPSHKTIMENKKVTFHCAAIGNPVPQIVWMKNEELLGFGEALSFKAQRNQSGEYWCSASNGLGEAVNASANLDVQCA